MSNENSPLTGSIQKIKVQQAVGDYFHVMDEHKLTNEEALVAWNMLGFTLFQEMNPDETHAQTQERMMAFSRDLYASSLPAGNS